MAAFEVITYGRFWVIAEGPGFVSDRRSFDMRYASDPSSLVKQKTNKNPASAIHGTTLRRPDRHASGKR
jgi:hypothetical protein